MDAKGVKHYENSMATLFLFFLGNKKLLLLVAELFESKPHPRSDQLIKLIASLEGKNEVSKYAMVEKFAHDFHIDPRGRRSDEKHGKKYIREQFSEELVDQAILGLRNSNGELLRFYPEFLKELKRDFRYVNAIGHRYSMGEEFEEPLSGMSRKKLLKSMEQLKTTLNNPNISESKRYLTQLQMVAVLREVMYRATGKFPNSTQVLSVLMQTKLKDNVCMQINTGEGKSIINPLLAAMRWAEGYAVNVFTSNHELARRDLEEAKDFWAYLGIDTAFIEKHSLSHAYLKNGINYTTPADFALFHSQSIFLGNALNSVPMAGIYDEADLSFYESRTSFNYSKNLDEDDSDPFVNLFAWVYAPINDFVTSADFAKLVEKLNVAYGEEEKQIISYRLIELLRLQLYSRAMTEEDRTRLAELSDDRLLQWLTAAAGAVFLRDKLGEKYIIKEMIRDEYGKKKKYRKIVLLDGEKHELEGAILAKGAQQFLSVYLQGKPEFAKGSPFVVDPETSCVSSTSQHSEFLRMDKLTGVTGTTGSKELFDVFGIPNDTLRIKIPPHLINRRVDKFAVFAENSQDHLHRIAKELSRRGNKNQLIIGANGKQCDDIFRGLEVKYRGKKIDLIMASAEGFRVYHCDTGAVEELHDIEDAVSQAGQDGKNTGRVSITVATALLGRGVNIKNLGKVIMTSFNPDSRFEGQVMGRTGRYGAEGSTIGIYDWSEICAYYPEIATKQTTKLSARRKALNNIRKVSQRQEVINLELFATLTKLLVKYQSPFDKLYEDWERSKSESERADEISKQQCQLLASKNEFLENMGILQSNIAMNPRGDGVANFEIALAEELQKYRGKYVALPELVEVAASDVRPRSLRYSSIGKFSIIAGVSLAKQYAISATFPGAIDAHKLELELQQNNEARVEMILQDSEKFIVRLEDSLKKSSRTFNSIFSQSVFPTVLHRALVACYKNMLIFDRLKYHMSEVHRNKVVKIKNSLDTIYGNYLASLGKLTSSFKQRMVRDLSLQLLLLDTKQTDLPGQFLPPNVLGKAEKACALRYLMDHLQHNSSEHLKEKIIANEATGDPTVDFLVAIIRTNRSAFNPRQFSDTATFKALQRDLQLHGHNFAASGATKGLPGS